MSHVPHVSQAHMDGNYTHTYARTSYVCITVAYHNCYVYEPVCACVYVCVCICACVYSCGQITLDPCNFEAGRKFSFEIKTHENPIIVWNYCQLQLFQLNNCCFRLFPNWFRLFPAASKIAGSKVICPQLYVCACLLAI